MELRQCGPRLYLGEDVGKDLPSAVRLYGEACKKGSGAACRSLGGICARGELGEALKSKAQELFAAVCGPDAACQATVARGDVPTTWGGNLDALRPERDAATVLSDLSDKSVEPPRLLHQTRPHYPSSAFQRRIAGVVHLSVLIDPSGVVSDVRVVRSIPELDAAAIECVRRWRFEPARREGVAVPTIADAPITFNLL